jgi:hydroxymethylbilane synthase
MRPLTIGTRGSALALRQVELVTAAIRASDPSARIETVIVQTEGDRRAEVSLEEIGGQGVFVKDIEARLQRGEVDIAVHSLKDMPAEQPDGLTIAAVLPRADARDALAARDGRDLAALPSGARIGSDSARRAMQIHALRPDVEVVSIRGNVDTRLRKVEAGEYDAAVLAVAGLQRLDLLERATQVFTLRELLPAVGQGVLAVQCRTDDIELVEYLAAVDDSPTRVAAEAERAFLRALGAGCRLPVGAYATLEGENVRLEALLGDEQGRPHRGDAQGPASAAERLGAALAHRLRLEARV